MSSLGGGLQVPKPHFPALSSPQRATGNISLSSSSNGIKESRKVGLAPGHSLMDWVRLGHKEGKKLNGIGGVSRQVSSEELARHNKVDDAWISVRGRVYNVSPYMSFHPGGEDEMMRGTGQDGTALFDDVHQWVNVESMLEKCYVGQLIRSSNRNVTSPTDVTGVKTVDTSAGLKSPSKDTFLKLPQPVIQIPKARYDWYQNGGTIIVTIYAKCNSVKPEHLVIDRKHRDFRATLQIDEYVYTVHVGLSHDITNTFEGVRILPGPIHRAIFVLNKKDPDLKWLTFGESLPGNNSLIRRIEKEPVFRQCEVLTCRPLTHDIKLFALQLPAGCHMTLPIGYHVYLRLSVNGKEISRPYTAVSPSLLPDSKPNDEPSSGRVIYLMIKVYPDGQLTPKLDSLKEGDKVDVSDYEGGFTESRLGDLDQLVLVAAGTGFTPMIRLLLWSLMQPTQPRHIKLLFFNKKEDDIPWRDMLSRVAEAQPKRLEVHHILSDPNAGWAGPKGRIRKEIVQDYFPRLSQQQRLLTCICGPVPFTQLAFKLLRAHGCTNDIIHVFAA